MGKTQNLTEFLLAQIDLDERLARAAGQGHGILGREDNAGWIHVELPPDNPRPVYDLIHISDWSPQRVITDCAVFRQIVEHEAANWGETTTMRLFGLRYADRVGYRDEFRPSA